MLHRPWDGGVNEWWDQRTGEPNRIWSGPRQIGLLHQHKGGIFGVVGPSLPKGVVGLFLSAQRDHKGWNHLPGLQGRSPPKLLMCYKGFVCLFQEPFMVGSLFSKVCLHIPQNNFVLKNKIYIKNIYTYIIIITKIRARRIELWPHLHFIYNSHQTRSFYY
jgi:hypothetical protein